MSAKLTGKSLANNIETEILYRDVRCYLLLCGRSGEPNITICLNFSEALFMMSSGRLSADSSRYSRGGSTSRMKRSSWDLSIK